MAGAVIIAGSACGRDAGSTATRVPPRAETSVPPRAATLAPVGTAPAAPVTTTSSPPGADLPRPTAAVVPTPPDALLVPGLPMLDGPARTYVWPAGGRPTRDDFEGLADALGVTGDITDGVYGIEGGWTLDGDHLELTMDAGVEGAWNYSGPPPFAWPSEDEPWPTIETGEPATVPPPTLAPGAPLPDTFPNQDRAQTLARGIVTSLGFDPEAFEWRDGPRTFAAQVEAWWIVDGGVAPVKLHFGFGPEGMLSFAYGQLVAPQAGPDIERIGTAAAEERLRAEIERTRARPPMGNVLVGGLVAPGDPDETIVLADPGEASAVPAEAAPPTITTAPAPTVPPELIGRIVEVEASWLVDRGESSTRLEPAYTFIEATGMRYTVSAAP